MDWSEMYFTPLFCVYSILWMMPIFPVMVLIIFVYIKWLLQKNFDAAFIETTNDSIPSGVAYSENTCDKVEYDTTSIQPTDDYATSGASPTVTIHVKSRETFMGITDDRKFETSRETIGDYIESSVAFTETNDDVEAGAECMHITGHIVSDDVFMEITDNRFEPRTSCTESIGRYTFCGGSTDDHISSCSNSTLTANNNFSSGVASIEPIYDYVEDVAVSIQLTDCQATPDVVSRGTTDDQVVPEITSAQTTDDRVVPEAASEKPLGNCNTLSVAPKSEGETIASELDISSVQPVMRRLMDSVCVENSSAEHIKKRRRIKPTRICPDYNLAGQSLSFSSDAGSTKNSGEVSYITFTGATDNHITYTSNHTDFLKHTKSKRPSNDSDIVKVESIETKETTLNLDILVSVHSLMEKLMNSACKKDKDLCIEPIKRRRIKPTRKDFNSNLTGQSFSFDERITGININDSIKTRFGQIQNESKVAAKSRINSLDSYGRNIVLKSSLNVSKSQFFEGSINSIPLEFIYPCFSVVN